MKNSGDIRPTTTLFSGCLYPDEEKKDKLIDVEVINGYDKVQEQEVEKFYDNFNRIITKNSKDKPYSGTFNDIVEARFKECKEVLNKKSDEYALSYDLRGRLHNFLAASSLSGQNPIKALGGMMVKHTVSIYDMISRTDVEQFPRELWDEKIIDSINYLFLLTALLELEKAYLEDDSDD